MGYGEEKRVRVGGSEGGWMRQDERARVVEGGKGEGERERLREQGGR